MTKTVTYVFITCCKNKIGTLDFLLDLHTEILDCSCHFSI